MRLPFHRQHYGVEYGMKKFRYGLIYLTLGIFLLLFFAPTATYASIYGYVDESGAYHFTNIKPANKQYQIIVETSEPAHGVQGSARPWRNDEERSGLINQAKAFLGVPYKLGGDNLNGMDCSAFVKRMFSLVDVALPRTAREQYAVGKRIPRQELTMGDLVFFSTKRYEQYPTHVGIYMGSDKFIHASALNKGGVRIDSLSSDFYNARFIGGSRVKALPEGGSTSIVTASK
jgi:cell wall-associated NlpC family hydrolase